MVSHADVMLKVAMTSAFVTNSHQQQFSVTNNVVALTCTFNLNESSSSFAGSRSECEEMGKVFCTPIVGSFPSGPDRSSSYYHRCSIILHNFASICGNRGVNLLSWISWISDYYLKEKHLLCSAHQYL